MARKTSKRIVLRVVVSAVAALLALHAALMFGLLGVDEIPWLAAGLFAVFVFFRPLNALLLSGTVLAVALILTLLIQVTGIDAPLYFKPTSRLLSYDFAHGYQIFEPGRELEMTEKFGDLTARTAGEEGGQEKYVRFVTDSRGFRNDGDYSGQEYLLVGDSFIVGASVTQEAILSSVLEREYGIRAYNVAAVGGDLADYARWSRDFYAEVEAQPRILLFFFEGNDFFDVRAEDLARPGLIERYRDMFRFMPLGKYAFSQYSRFKKRSGDVSVVERSVLGRRMLFNAPYVEVCRRKNYEGGSGFGELLAGLAEHVAVVYFIPAKYRIYGPLADTDAESGLPDAQWRWLSRLCAELGLPCVDLTPALAERSRELLPDGFTYYLDDTHWTARGIEAAARIVSQTIPARGFQD